MAHMILWHMYIVYDVRLDVHAPPATMYYPIPDRVVYHVELDILADLTLEFREEYEAKGELSCGL